MLKPLSKEGWNYETAAHLLNRAGFGGPPEEIARLAGLGHEAALSLLLDYEQMKDPTPNPAWKRGCHFMRDPLIDSKGRPIRPTISMIYELVDSADVSEFSDKRIEEFPFSPEFDSLVVS